MDVMTNEEREEKVAILLKLFSECRLEIKAYFRNRCAKVEPDEEVSPPSEKPAEEQGTSKEIPSLLACQPDNPLQSKGQVAPRNTHKATEEFWGPKDRSYLLFIKAYDDSSHKGIPPWYIPNFGSTTNATFWIATKGMDIEDLEDKVHFEEVEIVMTLRVKSRSLERTFTEILASGRESPHGHNSLGLSLVPKDPQRAATFPKGQGPLAKVKRQGTKPHQSFPQKAPAHFGQ